MYEDVTSRICVVGHKIWTRAHKCNVPTIRTYYGLATIPDTLGSIIGN